jgi:hemolysin activation/secretion protein
MSAAAEASSISFFLLRSPLVPSFVLNVYVAYDIGYLKQAKFNELLAQAEELGRIIGGLRVSVKKSLDREPRK